MPRILIVSMHDDAHAKAVSWGLRSLGQDPVLWSWSDFPHTDSGAWRLDSQGGQGCSVRIGGTDVSDPFDVIWVRRRSLPVPVEGTHPDDREMVLSDSRLFLGSILPRLGHAHTRWVNHPHSQLRSDDKATQLEAAQALGLRIPDTLIGNDIGALRAFFQRHPGGIVHKSLAPMNWTNVDGSRTTSRTSQLTAAHLEDGFAVHACPGIYQEKIDKKYELRVTVIGDTVLAATIDSQRDRPTVDWRYEGGRSTLAATELAPGLADRCLTLCRQLGLNFGCIDLVVTPADEVVFLEVNSAGQFLFKELDDPQLPMLDAFCRYLATGDTQLPTGATTTTMADYHAWAQSQLPPREAA